MRTVLVECAAVARAHEEARFGKPTYRASQVGAVYGEDLKFPFIDAADPTGNVCRLTIPRPRRRILVHDEPCLLWRELVNRTERHPRLRRLGLGKGREDEAEDRDPHQRRTKPAQPDA